MSPANVWDVLGIEATEDATTIRRAYARRLKVTQPEDDPKGFQALRDAYERALWLAENRQRMAAYEALEDEDEFGGDEEDDGSLIYGSPAEVFRPGQATPPPPPPAPVERPEPVILSPAPAVAERDPGSAPRSLEEELLARELEREGQALREDSEELERLLQATPFDADAAVRQLKRLLQSPALLNIGMAAGFEAWIENVLLSNLPNADPLIPLVVRHYRWRRNEESLRHQVGDGAVARDDDLIKFRDLFRAGGRYRNAARALTAPPTRLRTLRWLVTPGLAAEVAEVLKAFRTERPGLIQNLNAESVAWWEAAPERPRPGVGAFLLAMIPFVVLWMAAIGLGDAMPWAWATLIALASSAALAAGSFYGVTLPRLRWTKDWSQTAPAWVRWGWAGAAVAAPLVAAGLISVGLRGWSVAIPVGLIGLVAAVWSRIVGERDASPVSARAMNLAPDSLAQGTGRLFLRNLYAFVFWGWLPASLPIDQWLPLSVGVMACLLAVHDDLGGLKRLVDGVPPAERKGYYPPAFVFIVASIVLVAGFGSVAGAKPWLAILVAMLVIAEPVADAVLNEDAMRQRAGIMVPLLGILWMFLPMITLWQDGALRIDGVWVLCGWLLALWYGLRRDRKLALPDRPRIRFGNIP